MVLVGTGGVDHEQLVKHAEQHFANLPVSPNPIPLGRLSHPKTDFVGSEVRIRDDTLPTAHVAIAVEGVGWSSPDYFPMLVMQSIFGNWDRSLGAAGLMSSRLSHIISSHNLANSFMSFSTSYSDTGLWGIYLVTENLMNMDDLAHSTLREWTRMSIAPKDVEVERAKSQLKASLLLSLDGSTAIAEDIGRQLVTSGRRMTPKQIEFAVDAVTTDDVKRVAQKYLWDKDVRSPSPSCSCLRSCLANDVCVHRSPLLLSAPSTACSTTTVSALTCRPCSTRLSVVRWGIGYSDEVLLSLLSSYRRNASQLASRPKVSTHSSSRRELAFNPRSPALRVCGSFKCKFEFIGHVYADCLMTEALKAPGEYLLVSVAFVNLHEINSDRIYFFSV